VRVTDRAAIRKLVAVDPKIDPGPILDLLVDSGAILEGHFSLPGGDHTHHFIRFRQIGRDDERAAIVARLVLEAAGIEPRGQQVLVPESAGFLLGHAIAQITGGDCVVARIDDLRLPTGEARFGEIRADSEVLVVNDVVSTGATLVPMIDLVARQGARTQAVLLFAVLRRTLFVQRMNEMGLRGACLVECVWDVHRAGPETCPMCRDGEPLILAAELN
jgi:orotate phosphoribosyltransferase